MDKPYVLHGVRSAGSVVVEAALGRPGPTYDVIDRPPARSAGDLAPIRAHTVAMLGSSACRAKAADALANAAIATNPRLKIHWEQAAQDWLALAVAAELQEKLQRDLLANKPD